MIEANAGYLNTKRLWLFTIVLLAALSHCTSGSSENGFPSTVGGSRVSGGAPSVAGGGTAGAGIAGSLTSGGIPSLGGHATVGGFSGKPLGGVAGTPALGGKSGIAGIGALAGAAPSGGKNLGGNAGAHTGGLSSAGTTSGSAGAGGIDPLKGLDSLQISPTSADLFAGDNNTAQTFTLTGHFKDGSTRDVTPFAWWTVTESGLVTLANNNVTPTGQRGGTAILIAGITSFTSNAELRVTWKKTQIEPGVTPTDVDRLKGTEDPALAPQLVYPLTDTLLPTNLPSIEVQWKPATGTTLFEVSLAGPQLDMHIITPCRVIDGNGCGLTIEKTTWAGISTTLAGTDAASITVRAAGATAGKVGTSARSSVQFTREPIRGGLYYFNTYESKNIRPGIHRYDFTTNKVEPFFTSGRCAGCHAITKDGTKMLASICTTERDCDRPQVLAVVDVATKAVMSPPMPVGDSDTQTWSPDNKFYVTTPSCSNINPTAPFGCKDPGTGQMTLVEATKNTAVGTVPAGQGALFPAFSNRGDALVYTRGSYLWPVRTQKSSLYSLSVNTNTTPPQWGAEKLLFAASAAEFENNYHPSFSPNDQWVLFTRSQCISGIDNPSEEDWNINQCDSYNDTTARTWVVPAAGGTAIECARANGAGRNTVSWPKWAPFRSSYKDGDVFFYTVSSTRDYGFRATHSRDAAGNATSGVQQLWLVGFDPAKAAAGLDPSFAPVWLPFQDISTSNHIGQWTETIVQ